MMKQLLFMLLYKWKVNSVPKIQLGPPQSILVFTIVCVLVFKYFLSDC